MTHAHDHHHHHHPPPGNYHRAFGIGVALNLAYIAVEAFFGFRVNSLALLADAGHNLSDVLTLLLAWGAAWISTFQPTPQRTYGWRKSSILAALFNSILLVLAMGGIAWEAVHRFGQPQPVAGGTIMLIAGFGVVVNTATALLFMKGRQHDLNVKGAFLHMAADAGVSGGVVMAGLLIQQTGWQWLDPAVSLGIVIVIGFSTWGLLRDSVNLVLDAVPAGIDVPAVETYLAGLPGIHAVHDLHIWGMSTTQIALTAHLVKPDAQIDDEMLARIREELHEHFGIEHITIQLERGGPCECRQAAPGSL